MAGTVGADPANAAGLGTLERTVRIRLRRQAAGLAHDHSHVLRVVRNAEQIAAAHAQAADVTIDGDTLRAACLLHEIGRGAERRGETLSDATLRIAEEMLRGEGLGALVWPVCETLAQHLTPGRQPESSEAMVLNDADLLEDLGAIGLARTIADAVGQATPLLYDPEDPEARNRDLDDATHLLDRLPKRHFHLPAAFATEWGRGEADRRVRVLAAYYKAFLREAGFG